MHTMPNEVSTKNLTVDTAPTPRSFCGGGSPEFLSDLTIDERLRSYRREVTELEAEKERRAAFTLDQILADRLHNLLHSKVDCDYLYSQWPNPTGCRQKFLDGAKAIRAGHYSGFECAIVILENLR